MAELRYDHTTADWVVFAPLRKLRPHRDSTVTPVSAATGSDRQETCPFCPGNEALTPHEIFAIREYGAGPNSNWQVRVVPNKFPALRIEEDNVRIDLGPVFHQMGGCGAHEVVVESPHHEKYLAQLPVEHVELVLKTLQQRFCDLMRDRRFQSIIIFKNHGEAAGTSLRHPHWQIIATPVVPRLLRLKHIEATEYFDRYGRGLYSVILEEELAAESRIVAMNDDFVAFVPYAAHIPFELWIVSRRPESRFEELSGGENRSLATILKSVLLKLYSALENPDFNLTIDMPPRGDARGDGFQWHLRILPRLSTAAGFELGSGMSINTVLPEDAAAFLRQSNGAAIPAYASKLAN